MPVSTSAKRLPKDDRRAQLLGIALEIVREEGTDALTLARLADQAGVSKPIAYTHFTTRSGLLAALYEHLDRMQTDALKQALMLSPRRLEDIARVIATAYVECHRKVGPEFGAIAAALKGDPDMDAFHQKLLDQCLAILAKALGPFAPVSGKALRLRCVAMNGACEALARDESTAKMPVSAAVGVLTATIVALASAKA